ncbi:MAG TPA: cytochrome c [Phycisphaerae bacterium]|nr:cytochrome c [Phycisphaerae bacterium]
MSTMTKSVLAIAAIFSTAALAAWGNDPPAATVAFKPVQPLEKLMEGQKKLHAEIKDAILDKAWEEAQVSAWLLAEIANVNHYQKPDPEFRALATKMSGECVELANLLAKRDQKGAMEQYTRIGKTCGACHEKYEKKE